MRRFIVLIVSFVAALAMAPGSPALAAAPTWTIVPSPNPLLNGTEFSGIDCSAATSCLAVGSHDVANKQIPAAAIRSGSTWSRVSPPAPTGAQLSNLLTVSCSAGTCVAVGRYYKGGNEYPLAEQYSGGAWTIMNLAPVPNAAGTFLTAVSCSSATVCTATGWAYPASGTPDTFVIERWANGVWTLQTGATVPGTAFYHLGESGVSCPTDTFCLAASATDSGAFAERWNGTDWTLVPVPQPGNQTAFVTSIDCVNATHCQLVGARTDSGSGGLLAEGWNGTSLTVEDVPNPDGSSTLGLSSVSCASATQCRAVGLVSVAFLFANGTWTTTPIPAQHALTAISCVSVNACRAAGYSYLTLPAQSAAVVGTTYDLTGSTWHAHQLVVASDYSATVLTGVSCASATDCAAIGQITDQNPTLPVAMTGTGSSWTLAAVNRPGAFYGATFEGVGCGAASAGDVCAVVGQVQRNQSQFPDPGVAVRTSGAYDFAVVARTPKNMAGELSGVSCPGGGATVCTAVGYLDATPNRYPFVETYNGRSWVQGTPVDPGDDAVLTAISCPTASFCLTIGTQNTGAQPLLETWNGSAWAVVTAPTGATSLSDVSCSSATACAVAGRNGNAPYIATWNGTAWTTQSITLPPTITSARLDGISCAPTCQAVGQAQNGSGTHPFGVRQVTKGWSARLIPQPAGASSSSLADVSCVSAADCTAVGTSTVAGVIATLIERFQ